MQQPGPVSDIAGDPGGETVELGRQPQFERRWSVVEEHADVVEHFRGPLDAQAARPKHREDLRVRDHVALGMAGQDDDQGLVDVQTRLAGPAAGLAKAVGAMAGPGQPGIAAASVLITGPPREVSAGFEHNASWHQTADGGVQGPDRVAGVGPCDRT
ncbi:hypothetical protein ACWCQP_37365 [Streptomyces chartreusis]